MPERPHSQLFGNLEWPTDEKTVTQRFRENPQNYAGFGLPGHDGWDIRAADGSAVKAVLEGTVYDVAAEPRGNYGIQVRVQHDRHLGGYKTVYAHGKKALVKVGDQVTKGQRLMDADSTGNSTGSHLHLTLKKDGATERGETDYPSGIVDPGPWLEPLLAPALPYSAKVKAGKSVIVRYSTGKATASSQDIISQ